MEKNRVDLDKDIGWLFLFIALTLAVSPVFFYFLIPESVNFILRSALVESMAGFFGVIGAIQLEYKALVWINREE